VIGRSAILIAGCWLLVNGSVSGQEIAWDRLADGLRVAVWQPGPQCQTDVPPLYVVMVDPEQVRFATYHFRDEGLPAPPTIQEWQQRTGASVLFNAGLFREDFTYLGLLFKDGRSLGGKRHPVWQGLFAAEPVKPGLGKARVLDLSADSFAVDSPAYREAAQSLMLLDRSGQPRVRRTGKRAHQTVVGESGDGKIFVIKTVEEVGLRALAECLRDGFPAIHQAMAMDGGSSSDLLIGPELLKEQAATDRGGATAARPWRPLVDGSTMEHIPLPAVIGLFPRTKSSAQP
jgi:uncharacterized protein YigE (DUF2233 family)